jgi:glutamate carboxypeptidase
LVSLGVSVPTSAQDLSPAEAQVVEWVEANWSGAVDLLERLVNINSGTMNHAGVREVGLILRDRLGAIGFDAEWLDLTEEVGRAGHVVAHRKGTAGKHVLLLGHIDTVFELGHPFRYFEREGPIGRGPGAADMKGGDVVLVYALEALHQAGALDNVSITVVYTGDEESVGSPRDVSRRVMIDAAREADYALSFERGFSDDTGEYATVARRGSSGWTLTVTGRQAHSSRIFSEAEGAGAVYEAARILNQFYEEMSGEEHLTFNVGTILGGTTVSFDTEASSGEVFGKGNVIPNTAVVRGDLRTISQDQLESARARMREIVSRHLPRTSAAIVFRDGYPAMSPREGNYALLEVYNRVNEALGYPAMEPLDPGRRGAGDIAFASDYVDGALDGLGVYGGGSHGPEEWVELGSLQGAIKRAALLIYRLTHYMSL